MPMYLDILPFDAVCDVCKYLSFSELHTVTKLGPVYEEAAESVVSRRSFTHIISHKKFANDVGNMLPFLQKTVRQLELHFNYKDGRSLVYAELMIRLMFSAELLDDLSIFNCSDFEFIFKPTYFGQLRPLKKLLLQNDNGENHILLSPIASNLQQLQELRLHFACTADNIAAIAGLVGLRTLHIQIDNRLTEKELVVFGRNAGPEHQLRHLSIVADENHFTEQMGVELKNFAHLHTLHLSFTSKVYGVDALLRGCSGHPKLRVLQMNKGDWDNFVEPQTLYQYCQQLVHLDMCVELVDYDQLGWLAQMRQLHTLKLHMEMLCDHQLALANAFVRDLAAANTLTTLHLTLQDGASPFVLEPATIEALRGFTSLRELKLVALCPMSSVKALLIVMQHLESFENNQSFILVARRKSKLARLRPELRKLIGKYW